MHGVTGAVGFDRFRPILRGGARGKKRPPSIARPGRHGVSTSTRPGLSTGHVTGATRQERTRGTIGRARRTADVPRLSWNEIQDRALTLAVRWGGETDETGESQTFWGEFLDVFGIDRRRHGARPRAGRAGHRCRPSPAPARRARRPRRPRARPGRAFRHRLMPSPIRRFHRRTPRR